MAGWRSHGARACIFRSGHVTGHKYFGLVVEIAFECEPRWIIAGVAFVGASLGFMIAQVIVCNTALYCDALSYRFYIVGVISLSFHGQINSIGA